MASTEDVDPENIPLVTNDDNCEWRGTVHIQLLRSTRVLVHLYAVKLLVNLTVGIIEGSLGVFSNEVWQFSEEGRDVLLLSFYDSISPCLPLCGGLLADTVSGTTRTTIGGIICIAIACCLFTLDAFPYEDVFKGDMPLAVSRTIFVLGLSFLFVGNAGVEANIDPLAAKHKERKGYPAVRTIYHSLFWFETIGVAIAFILSDSLEEDLDFSLFYGIGCILILVALIVMVTGRSCYIPSSLPKENVVVKTFSAISEAMSRRFSRKVSDVPLSNEINSFLDYAKLKHGGSFQNKFMDDVRHLVTTMYIFHNVMLYSIVVYQVNTSFREQTRRMDLAAGNVVYPNITFQLVSSCVILVTLPILLCVYPKIDNSDIFKLTPLRKIGIGIVFAGMSLISAAIVETERKNVMEDGGYFIQTVNNISYNASRLNVLYQLPQYTFIGISEAVIRTSASELAFTQSPDNMKGIFMGIYLMMSGLGSFLINLILTWIINFFTAGNEWLTDEMNDGYYEYFFYVLTGLQLLNVLLLYMRSRKYSYKSTPSIKTFYQQVTFSNEGGVTVVDSIDGASGDIIPDDWEYVAIVHRKSLPRFKKLYHQQYGTDDMRSSL